MRHVFVDRPSPTSFKVRIRVINTRPVAANSLPNLYLYTQYTLMYVCYVCIVHHNNIMHTYISVPTRTRFRRENILIVVRGMGEETGKTVCAARDVTLFVLYIGS